jgi:D-tyrosyl-tRNA(Tyr) deacylase
LNSHHSHSSVTNSDVRLRLVVQRAAQAEVHSNSMSHGQMGRGLVVLFGVAAVRSEENGEPRKFEPARDKDLAAILEKVADKLVGLRIFSDADGKMNLSVGDVSGGVYIISQFTLFADCKKGFRPGFSAAARPPFATEVYENFVNMVKAKVGGLSVFTGEFGADMLVNLVNDGPVTVVIDADIYGIS